jgi:secreted trypsin-like serine protease
MTSFLRCRKEFFVPKRLLALVVLALASLTGTAVAAPSIVGGTNADQPYPFAVSLHGPSGRLFCAGALVAPAWVVTAAHCVFDKKPNSVSARVGTNDVAQGGEVAQAAEIVVNPAFTPDPPAGDLALIRLAAPVQAPPIALAAAAAPGTETRMLGWGQTCPTPSCGQIPTVLQQLDTHIVEGAKCTAVFDGTVELCTDNPGGKAGSCYGDSGSPEIVKDGDHWLLVGVTSRPGNGDPTCATAPSIYTSVVAYAPWITTKIAPKP